MAESKLTDLIAKLEAAAEGSRALDRQVALAAGVLFLDDGNRLYALDRDDGGRVYGGLGEDILIRPFTTSLDAIVALIERKLPGKVGDLVHDARAAVSRDHALHIRFWKPDTDGSYTTALALALCIALLSALQLQGGSEQ